MHTLTPHDEFLFDVETDIGTHGYHITGVLADLHGPGYTYTIGHLLEGQPELVIVGLPDDRAQALFWLLHHVREHGTQLAVGPRATYETELADFCLLPVPPVHWTQLTGDLSGIPSYYRAIGRTGLLAGGVLQVVWADGNGCLPWDQGADPALVEAQPVLALPGYSRP